MPDQERNRERRCHPLTKAQRAIVMQLLRDDHEQHWPRAELRREIPDFTRYRFEQALDFLEGNQVISRDADGRVSASLFQEVAEHLVEW